MRSRLSKWVIPGILTVLIGTAAAMQLAKPQLEGELSVRASDALEASGVYWADVQFSGRDAELSGISGSEEQSEAAATLISELRGVRVVNRSVQTARRVSPYLFSASIKFDQISLNGGAPDEAARRSIEEKMGLSQSDLLILSGVEDRANWLTATDFALRQLQHLDDGTVQLTDMKLSISGRAKSRASFETMTIVLDAGFPPGVERGDVSIIPPLESPFTWQAEYDGAKVQLSGFVPDQQAMEAIERAAPDDKTLVSDVLFASGAPVNFGTSASTLVSAFGQVTSGSAQVSDQDISFSGTPLSAADANDLTARLATINAEINLETPTDTASNDAGETLIAQNEVLTPPLPLLDQLSAPPKLQSNGQEEAIQSDVSVPETEITTPELPNLDALASPPQLPTEVAEPQQQRTTQQATTTQADDAGDLQNAADPEASEEAQSQVEASVGAGASEQTAQSSPTSTDSETDAAETSVAVTPPLPNLTELSTPPVVETAETEKDEVSERQRGSAANEDEEPKADEPLTIASIAPQPDKVEEDPLKSPERTTLCQNLVAGFQDENSILFAPASANLTEESGRSLNRLAVFLKQCPSAEVHVEGHTDSDGPEQDNLALSVARAEAVVIELIARGVDAGRLYAIGYGESVPLVSNNTRDGKRKNRRIAFQIIQSAE